MNTGKIKGVILVLLGLAMIYPYFTYAGLTGASTVVAFFFVMQGAGFMIAGCGIKKIFE